MQRLLIPALCATTLAAPVMAGGLSDPIVSPPAAPVTVVTQNATPYDFYIGGQFGLGVGTVTPNDPSAIFREFDIEGPFHGVHAGVQRTFGALTLGVEVDYTSNTGDLEANENPTTFINVDALAHLKLRAGSDIGPALVYGTAGLAYADITIQQGNEEINLADTAPFFGLGADMMVTDSISLGAEYLVHSFEDMDGSDTELDLNTAMLRVSYHF